MSLWINLTFTLLVCYLISQVQCEESNRTNTDNKGLYGLLSGKNEQIVHRTNRVKRFGSITAYWRKAKEGTGRFFTNVVPDPVKNLFRKKEVEGNQEIEKNNSNDHDIDPSKERGMWDSFGRDVIREISKTASKVGKKIGFTSSSSSGLDTNKSFFDGVMDKFKEHTQLIVPGTLWCGDGNKTKSREELGYFDEADACCREHDECPDNIQASGEKYGLQNTGLFTRSHCDCDMKFFECLKNAKDKIAKQIGFTYFSVLGPQCFKMDYPIEDCQATRKSKCLRYVLDTDAPKIMQWFDSPPFDEKE